MAVGDRHSHEFRCGGLWVELGFVEAEGHVSFWRGPSRLRLEHVRSNGVGVATIEGRNDSGRVLWAADLDDALSSVARRNVPAADATDMADVTVWSVAMATNKTDEQTRPRSEGTVRDIQKRR